MADQGITETWLQQRLKIFLEVRPGGGARQGMKWI